MVDNVGADHPELDPGVRELLRGAYDLHVHVAPDVMVRGVADVVVTHTDADPFNPDHAVAFHAVARARTLAAGAGVASAFRTIRPPELFLFEPHQPELCNFTPTTFVDITPVVERKRAAMAAMESQVYLQRYYAERAEHRANHARRASGNQEIRHAEAFQRVLAQVVAEL